MIAFWNKINFYSMRDYWPAYDMVYLRLSFASYFGIFVELIKLYRGFVFLIQNV